MNKEKILGIIRHLLTFGGGYLVARGVLDAGALTEVSAAIISLIGFAWSIFAPEKKKEVIEVAKAAGVIEK